MRRNARVDGNHAALMRCAARLGCSTQSLAPLGQGCPDFLIGLLTHQGARRNLLIEAKDGSKLPSQRRLTPDEAAWHANWQGQVVVVTSEEELTELINRIRIGGE